MERIVVAIMAKAPRVGEVKTRLCPPLSVREATELYRCFLLDKIEQVGRLSGASPAIAFTPVEARPLFERLAPGFLLFPQEGRDLGSRLAHCFDHLLGTGYPGALAVDSDTPTLPSEFLERALAAIAMPDVDLVVGPSEDGGYYLIGLKKAERALFTEIEWSTPVVSPETLRRAEAMGLRVLSLPSWFDIDTPRDLERLRASLAQTAGVGPRHTRQFFVEHER